MTTKKTTDHNDWKNLVQGFVGNVLERMSDDISNRVHLWIRQLKRTAIGSILMAFGLLYLLIGLSILLNSILGQILPGLGYITVGILAILIGKLIANNKA